MDGSNRSIFFKVAKKNLYSQTNSNMACIIQKFQCTQSPDLNIIGVGSNPVKFLVRAPQVVGTLIGKDTPSASLHAMHTFFRSAEGARMQIGGDIETAYRAGDMGAMVYTHYYYSGRNPSYFMTLDGVRETLRSLPNQIEPVAHKFRELLDSFSDGSSSSFNLDTRDVGETMDHDEDEEIHEPASGGALVPRSMLSDVRLQSYMKQTEAQLTLERERTAMERERTAMATTMAKMNAGKDKEMADLVLRTEREKADLQLKSEKEKNDLQLKSEKEKTDLLMRLRDFELQSEKEKSQAKDAIIEQMKKQLETAGRTESERAKKRASTASDPSEQDDSPVPFRLTIPNEVSGFVIVH